MQLVKLSILALLLGGGIVAGLATGVIDGKRAAEVLKAAGGAASDLAEDAAPRIARFIEGKAPER